MLRTAPRAAAFIRAMRLLVCAQALSSTARSFASSRAPLFILTRSTIAEPSQFARGRGCALQSATSMHTLATGSTCRPFPPVFRAPLPGMPRPFTGIMRPEPNHQCRMQLRGGAEIPPRRAASSSGVSRPPPDAEPSAAALPVNTSPKGAARSTKFYAVAVGLSPGIYATWEECRKATGPGYTRFATVREKGGGGAGRGAAPAKRRVG